MSQKKRSGLYLSLLILFIAVILVMTGCVKEDPAPEAEEPVEQTGVLTGNVRTAMDADDNMVVKGVEVLLADGSTTHAYWDKGVTDQVMKDMEVLVESYDDPTYPWRIKEILFIPEIDHETATEEKDPLVWYLFYSGDEPLEDTGEARTLEIELSQKLDRPVTLEIAPADHSPTVLSSGEAQLALLDFDVFIKSASQAPYQVVLIPENEFASAYYRGEIVVKADHPAQSFSDLEGSRFAYTTQDDLAGYHLIAKMIADLGKDAASFFGQTLSLQYSSEAMIDALMQDEADAGILYSTQDFSTLEWFGVENDLRIVDTTAWLPSQILVLSEYLTEEDREEITRTLLELNSDPEAAEAMRNLYNGLFNITGFHKPDAAFKTTDQNARSATEISGW
ncbi:PhnD/SsuA/transferrin family substrate-binding protein [Alkalibacter rhizosphaerae]|uniref:PhnD/SsuA/transferrin family substrate-binding protein n=1 Tax=Alkalibacter rhizosphaerae TaxID=2815577 RepID=A0A975AI78_9FIRM|nr:PhnD/SsuA/transferrin family substrate-binding protein [Alkalibacter rhizosphaerae]QSX09187.1 PhnD/SsuA/transferrin family substrate-binding protein [Alkalibacter rhizosphaerae]